MSNTPTDIFAITDNIKRQNVKNEVSRITSIVYDQLNRDEFKALAEKNIKKIQK
jgi:hypothetical protein